MECLDHFINGPWPKGIEYPRAINTYGCYAVLFGVYNIVERLHVLSCGVNARVVRYGSTRFLHASEGGRMARYR